MSGWCTIESDPGVFTSLVEEIGVKGAVFEEIYSLDQDTFAQVDAERTYGLVFLFKWQTQDDSRATVDAAEHGLFFANQVIENACATQAILSVLMNSESDKLDIGPNLREFKEFAVALDPQMKGLAIGNSEVIRKAHNSFRHQSSFEIVQEKDEKGEAFHFIGYICHAGKVYELDGLKPGPILVGDVPPGQSWLEPARAEIQRRIEAYSTKVATDDKGSAELRFNLMTISSCKMREAEKRRDRERYLKQRANISLVSRGEDVTLDDEIDDDDAPADIPSFEALSEKEVPEVNDIIAKCTTNIDKEQDVIEAEKKKRGKWAKENNLRRHDLIPLALCAMRHLARRKELVPAFEKGKEAHLKRVAEKKAAEAA